MPPGGPDGAPGGLPGMPHVPGPNLTEEQQKLLAEVEKKYGKNTPENPLKYEVKKGTQTRNIDLTVP